MTASQQARDEHDYVDLSSILQILKDKKWFILTTSIVLFIFSMSYMFFKPLQYQSSLILQIQQTPPNNLESTNKASPRPNLDNVANDIAAQLALIRSKLILGPVIDTLGLNINIKENYSWLDFLTNKNTFPVHINTLDLPPKIH